MKVGRPITPIIGWAFLVWNALYLGAVYLLEQRFPDAAFFSNDSDAIIWVWLGGSIVFILGGWLLKEWLKNRMSEKSFDLLEIVLCLLFFAALFVLHHLYVPEFLRIF